MIGWGCQDTSEKDYIIPEIMKLMNNWVKYGVYSLIITCINGLIIIFNQGSNEWRYILPTSIVIFAICYGLLIIFHTIKHSSNPFNNHFITAKTLMVTGILLPLIVWILMGLSDSLNLVDWGTEGLILLLIIAFGALIFAIGFLEWILSKVKNKNKISK